MKTLMSLSSILFLAAGCASAPSISNLNQGVSKVVIVRNGTAPLTFSTGVIDASSFWAQYGSGVSGQTGGGALWQDLQSSGQQTVMSEAEKNARMVQQLYGNHDLTPRVMDAVLPRLASAWSAQYDAKSVVTLGEEPAWVNAQRGLEGFDADADLILLAEIINVNLTERFSMGSALRAGLTMGTHRKALTTEVRVGLRAFKRPANGAGFTQAWFHMCGPNYTTMKTAYLLEELAQSPEKMREILDEATVQAIDGCSRALESFRS